MINWETVYRLIVSLSFVAALIVAALAVRRSR